MIGIDKASPQSGGGSCIPAGFAYSRSSSAQSTSRQAVRSFVGLIDSGIRGTWGRGGGHPPPRSSYLKQEFSSFPSLSLAWPLTRYCTRQSLRMASLLVQMVNKLVITFSITLRSPTKQHLAGHVQV